MTKPKPKQVHRCINCGANIPVASTFRREYCNAVCRQTHYRKRKRRE